MFSQLNAMNTDRPRDVLDGLLSHIVEIEAEFVPDLVVYDARNHDAARVSECLQPRRDVDAITEDIVTVDDDVTDVDAKAELDAAAVLSDFGIDQFLAVPLELT